MIHKVAPCPVMILDFGRSRVRLHKKTLRFIGDPEYILLLVSPEERTIAIARSDNSDLRAYRIQWTSFSIKKQHIEVQNRCLMRSLLELCANCQGSHTYRIYGECIPGGEIMRFDLENPIMSNKEKGHENDGIQDVHVNH